MGIMGRHEPIIAGRCLGFRSVQVLAYVRATIAEEGRAPSYDMIAEHLGFSSKARVSDVIKVLEKRGLLSRVGAGRVRRIRLMTNRNSAAPRNMGQA